MHTNVRCSRVHVFHPSSCSCSLPPFESFDLLCFLLHLTHSLCSLVYQSSIKSQDCRCSSWVLELQRLSKLVGTVSLAVRTTRLSYILASDHKQVTARFHDEDTASTSWPVTLPHVHTLQRLSPAGSNTRIHSTAACKHCSHAL